MGDVPDGIEKDRDARAAEQTQAGRGEPLQEARIPMAFRGQVRGPRHDQRLRGEVAEGSPSELRPAMTTANTSGGAFTRKVKKLHRTGDRWADRLPLNLGPQLREELGDLV